LDAIEAELEQSNALLKGCAARWRDFMLPARINRENILGDGYRYGEYRYSLDQERILELLMGENLYESPYVFVRELLQNAIDASRLREHLERCRGASGFHAAPIRVTQWVDRDGYRWVRVDDDGTGMDEYIVRKHLLKVGASYYGSAEFKADVLRVMLQGAPEFVPISRFGIGLLSCFIACDRVEISTLRQRPTGLNSVPLRLSLDGLQGFFTLRMPNLRPVPMPTACSVAGFEEGYRRNCGTSIACRLDPRKENAAFDLRQLLNDTLLAPPVPVEFEGDRVGGDLNTLASTMLCKETEVPFRSEFPDAIQKKLKETLSSDHVLFSLRYRSIYLDKYSPVAELRGQIVFLEAILSDSFQQLLQSWGFSANVTISYGNKTDIQLTFNGVTSKKILDMTPEDRDVFTSLVHTGKIASFEADEHLVRIESYFSSKMIMASHNGIRIPLSGRKLSMPIATKEFLLKSWGLISFSDSLRPQLSVARERALSLPWNMHSTLNLAIVRALHNDAGYTDLTQVDALKDFVAPQEISLGQLIADPLLHRPDGWPMERIFRTDRGMLSISSILALLVADETVVVSGLPSPSELAGRSRRGRPGTGPTCAAVLASVWVNLSSDLKNIDRNPDLRFVAKRELPPTGGELLFPPLAFVTYQNSSKLQLGSLGLNREHPFSQWLIENAALLCENYPAILDFLKRELLLGFGRDSISRAEAVRQQLDRLAEFDPTLRLPRSAIPAANDFEV